MANYNYFNLFLIQFLCLKNIRGFLHACVNNFGLKESVLFDAHELYDVSDFAKVDDSIVCQLYSIMHIEVAMQNV